MEHLEHTQSEGPEPEPENQEESSYKPYRHPQDQKLVDFVSQEISLIWPEITPDLPQHLDQTILSSLRGLDYFAKQKLILLLSALHGEQHDERPESRKVKRTLYGFVSLIDQIEKEIKEEDFDQRLTDAVWGLPRDKQQELLTKLEGFGEKEGD